MPIRFLSKAKLTNALSEMWKRELGTKLDPANNQWFCYGAGNSNYGLYGGLTDCINPQIQYDDKSTHKHTQSNIECRHTIIDNRNNLNPTLLVTLSHTHADSVTTTHTTNTSIQVTNEVDIHSDVEFEIVKAGISYKHSLQHTHSWTNSHSTNKSDSVTSTQEATINVPNGKVYEVRLAAIEHEVEIPYSILISVSGITETWFEKPVKKHYNWTMSANEAFAKICEWELAGDDSHFFSKKGVTQKGTVRIKHVSNFRVEVLDITDSYQPGKGDDETTPKKDTPHLHDETKICHVVRED